MSWTRSWRRSTIFWPKNFDFTQTTTWEGSTLLILWTAARSLWRQIEKWCKRSQMSFTISTFCCSTLKPFETNKVTKISQKIRYVEFWGCWDFIMTHILVIWTVNLWLYSKIQSQIRNCIKVYRSRLRVNFNPTNQL